MRAWTPRLTPLSVALIAVLLVALGILQYRWVGELSTLEHQRLRDGLRTAAERLQRDFDQELDRVWDTFRARRDADFPDEIVSDFEEWRDTTAFPRLIEAAYWVRAEADGLPVYRIGSSTVTRTEWPEALRELRVELERDAQLGRRRPSSYVTPVGSDLLALVVAQRRVSTPSRAVVLLRRDVIVEELIPGRVRELVAGEGSDYEITVVDEMRRAAAPPTRPRPAPPDIRVRLHTPEDIAFRRDGPEHAHLWSVLLQHRAGSLEAAVAEVRHRNLMVGAGVLLLLGASVLALVVATRRAQSLAEQQVQFVAGVSHELRTPITGISSLGQNLADGVVDDPARVRTYGETIHREASRLAGMIEQVLQFSAGQAGSSGNSLRPTSVTDVIDDAVAAMGDRLTRQYRFERTVEEPLPPVRADPRGLSSAVQNLLSNAMKFSAPGSLIRLSSRATGDAPDAEVHVSVEDRGHGIPSEERARVFEPFFRGSQARTQQVPGSGLGLSLVKTTLEAHGGRVTHTAAAGGGSLFTLHLPVAPGDGER